MTLHILGLLAQLAGAGLGPTPEPSPYSPEWFYRMAFADARGAALEHGLTDFYMGDFEGALAQTVGASMKGADLALAQGAVELAQGAQALLERDEAKAKAFFGQCVEHGTLAMATSEYESQVMRAASLKARCQSVMPDREAAVKTLQLAARDLPDPADAQEFLYGAARLEEDLGRYDSARALYGKALKVAPSGFYAGEAMFSMALSDLKRGEFAAGVQAVTALRELPQADAMLRARARVLEGRLHLASGDTARARMRFQQVANALTSKDAADRDSASAAEAFWRLGDLIAQGARGIEFTQMDRASRAAAHARRREMMNEAFGYWHQSIALMEYPWTPLSIRDIGATIEAYADAIARQGYDARNDTDRVANEILLQKKLPPIFQSAGRIYKRQIMLARRSGDGTGIGKQSGQGLARTWWQATRCQRDAARLLKRSLRPAGDSAMLAYYESKLDSAVRLEEWRGGKIAREGLQELVRWEQAGFPEVDSLKAYLGADASDSVVSIATRERYLAEGTEAPVSYDLSPLQWRWRIAEVRRLSRELVLDNRILRARLEGK